MSPRTIGRILALLGAGVLVGMLVFTVVLVRHRSRNRVLKHQTGLVPGTLLHAHNFHWTQMKGDKRQWELRATEASYSEDKTSLKLVGTELSMTLDDGKEVRLRAPKAELTVDGARVKRAELSGGLELNYGAVVLKTTEAVYLPETDELQGGGPVQIVGEGFTVSGVGLQANPHQRVFGLLHQVSTQLNPGVARVAAKNS